MKASEAAAKKSREEEPKKNTKGTDRQRSEEAAAVPEAKRTVAKHLPRPTRR